MDLQPITVNQQPLMVENNYLNKIFNTKSLRMFKNFIIILISVLISTYSLKAQDVIFQVTGPGESHNHLILDLPEGASFEHKGEGVFHITGMPDIYGPYKIGIKAGGNLLNGVTTADMALIIRHIMGNGPLSDDFRKTAADVDCDGRITVFDVIQIRRAILDRISEFGCQTNYKFWPENLEFFWEGSRVDVGEYISIKLGDVNNSATYNSSF